MIKKRYIITASGIISALLASLFVTNVLLANPGGEYDPWIDTNDDGIIDIVDVAIMASIYGTEGTPINKTELLLELEARLDSLNWTLINEYYNKSISDSRFAQLAHTHSGSDISGGTLGVDEILLGTAEGNSVIYFYEDGIPKGEYIYWQDSADRFVLSDDIWIGGSVNAYSFTMQPKTRYYSIPGSAWLPYRENYVCYRDYRETWTTTPSVSRWYAPVNLPHGAVVTELRAWVMDNDASWDITVYLTRQAEGSTAHMAVGDSTGASSSYQQLVDSSISYNPIDNQNYAYFVYAYLRSGNSAHKLNKVCITYTIDEPLP